MMIDFAGAKTARRFRVKQETKEIKMKKLLIASALVFGSVASTFAVAPIDITDVSTEVVPYISVAASAGLLIFGALYAIRVIIKAFRASGK